MVSRAERSCAPARHGLPRSAGGYKIKEHDLVVLKHNDPAHGLEAGDVGAVVGVHEGGGYEVEFVSAEGETVAVLTLTDADLRPMTGKKWRSTRKERRKRTSVHPGDEVLTDPGREDILGHRTVSDPDNDGHSLRLGSLEFEAVQSKESIEGDECGPLVCIDEVVILRDSESVRGGQRSQVGGGIVVPLVLRSCESGLEKPFVSNAETPTMLLDLIRVQHLENDTVQPGRL